jgi:hypothetical protein
MEYVYGTAVIDGVTRENLKTVGNGPVMQEGEYLTTVREYDDSTITDRCRIERHYESAEGEDGTKYEFYIISEHYRDTDKTKNLQRAVSDHDSTLDAMLGGDRTGTEADRSVIAAQLNAAARLVAEQQQDEQTVLELADLYEVWKPGVAYQEKKIIAYGVDAYGDTQLYTVVQSHTSAEHQVPGEAPSLYAPVGVTEDGYLEWRRPYGATDAYDIGDIVSYKGGLWICTQGDGAGKNTWEPGVYGWEKYSAEPGPEPTVEEWKQGTVYKVGDIVTHNGKTWECTQGDGAGNNSWEPGVYGWTEVTE